LLLLLFIFLLHLQDHDWDLDRDFKWLEEHWRFWPDSQTNCQKPAGLNFS
jgi:hypothetical protein